MENLNLKDIRTISLPPSYREMLEEAGRQLLMRKKMLLERALLIIWPYCVFIIMFYFIGFNSFSTALLVFSVVYSIMIRLLTNIEKRIWLDSYFDGKNLSQQQSWLIAKKIYPQAYVLL